MAAGLPGAPGPGLWQVERPGASGADPELVLCGYYESLATLDSGTEK